MVDFIKTLLKISYDNAILHIGHIGTNNTFNKVYRAVLFKLLYLKEYIEKNLIKSNFFISNLITRFNNGKLSLAVMKTDKQLYGFQWVSSAMEI